MYNVIMHHLNSFLSRSIRNLTLASLSRLFTMKIDVFPFLKVSIPKASNENQSHRFPINRRQTCKKYCLHISTL